MMYCSIARGISRVDPALQTHAVAVVLPAGDVLEPEHPSHAALPDASLYVPAAHSVHRPPLGPDVPALQVQAVKSVLAGSEMESLGQSSQAALPGVSL